jgi:hypothetical protein
MQPRVWPRTCSSARSSRSGKSVGIEHVSIRLSARRLHEGRMAPITPVVPVAIFRCSALPVGLVQVGRHSNRRTLAYARHRPTDRSADDGPDGHHHHPESPVAVQGREQASSGAGGDESKEDGLSHNRHASAAQRTRRLAVCKPQSSPHGPNTLPSAFGLLEVRSGVSAGRHPASLVRMHSPSPHEHRTERRSGRQRGTRLID